MDPNWLAFAREAASAAEHLAFGTTILGRANYAQIAYYTQAFFALSTGFERCTKLAILLDHALDHDGDFPSTQQLRGHGHNLEKLFDQIESIVKCRGLEINRPSSAIHTGILTTLSDFARNFTRYYNLDVLTGDARVAMRDDPIADWHNSVTEPVIAAHVSQLRRDQIDANARAVEDLTGACALVLHHAETGEEIDDVYSGSVRTGLTDASKPWERVYVLQLARFATCVVVELGHKARKHSIDIPHLSDFFAIFNNDDAMFRSRKTWSIY